MARILVADDAELILLLQRSFLKRTGCEVLGARGREETLAKARAERPDLVVMDAQMDGDAGLQTCRELKHTPDTKSIPLVMVTAAGDRETLLAAGADAVVSKPLDRGEILGAMGRFVRVDERASERRPVALRVDYSAGDREGVGFTKDLSAQGLFLKIREVFEPGDGIQVIFDLPAAARPTIRATGRVVRSVSSDPDSHLIPGVGLQFEGLSVRDRQDILEFLDSRGGVAS